MTALRCMFLYYTFCSRTRYSIHTEKMLTLHSILQKLYYLVIVLLLLVLLVVELLSNIAFLFTAAFMLYTSCLPLSVFPVFLCQSQLFVWVLTDSTNRVSLNSATWVWWCRLCAFLGRQWLTAVLSICLGTLRVCVRLCVWERACVQTLFGRSTPTLLLSLRLTQRLKDAQRKRRVT